MKPEIRWRLWVKDSERFTRNPLKDEVKLWSAIFGLGFLILIHLIHWLWS